MRIAKTSKVKTLTAVAAIIFCAAQASFAASALTVSSTGSGVFIVQGAGMDGVGALDLVLSYDTASLANPRVTQGGLISGAMMAVNLNTPGVVRAAIIRLTPFSGSGTLLTINFDRTGEALGTIIGLTVKMADIKGRPLQASVQIVNPVETASGNGTSSSSGSGSSGDTGSQQQKPVPQTSQTTAPLVLIPGGAVTKADEDAKPKPEQSPAVVQDQPGPAQEPVVAKTERNEQKVGADAMVPKKKAQVVYTRKSILEIFREYKGDKNPKTLTALFDQEPLIGFRQEPLVALSDGKSPVTVRFISTPERNGTADLVLTRAKLLSAKKDPEVTNTWIVTLLPEAGAEAAGLSVPQGELLMVFPLVVAPKVKLDAAKPGPVTEADFASFLKNRGTAKSPYLDLNHDGVRDYQDEYIYTANYLASQKK